MRRPVSADLLIPGRHAVSVDWPYYNPRTMSQPDSYSKRLHASRVMRSLYWAGGVLALMLAALGVVLPGLPTTPFVLVAGACFVRASPRAHAWLLRNKTFGPLLAEWERHHSVSRRVKRIALTAMALTAGFSLWFFNGQPLLQTLVLAGVAMGAIVVLRLPSRG